MLWILAACSMLHVIYPFYHPLTKKPRHAKLHSQVRKGFFLFLCLLSCRQLGASIFCPQYRVLFCPDMGWVVSAALLLDTAPSPADPSAGTCLQNNQRKFHTCLRKNLLIYEKVFCCKVELTQELKFLAIARNFNSIKTY